MADAFHEESINVVLPQVLPRRLAIYLGRVKDVAKQRDVGSQVREDELKVNSTISVT